ncbi:phage nozzle protein [Marinobacter similis]|uniref:Uncharacterized protein n=1 Tax=Marinobacter similis TaxID=1420916 RepID=W5YME5_9GAMM|nr:hypothetical protein [Marinobacter similis]AHI30276.1 hypothetical protein AU14_17530 [Marinobacter similis]
MIAFKRDIRDEADLPGANAPDGYQVRVRGDLESDSGGYWLTYDGSGGTQGIWVESTGLGTENRYDLTTMPLSLNRKQDISRVTESNPLGIFFELTTTDWQERKVGDEESAPFPYFMSEQSLTTAEVTNPRSITAMAIYQNRLIMASGDTLCISETGNFFNLFPTTVATQVDSDAMESTLDTNDVVNIKHITPGSGSLVLWTDRKQYVLQQDEVFTAGRLQSRMVTAEEADLSIEPLAVGNRVYFVAKRGKHNAVKEFFPVGDGFQFDTADVTAHVPEYIKGQVIKMVGNTSINALFVLTSDPR